MSFLTIHGFTRLTTTSIQAISQLTVSRQHFANAMSGVTSGRITWGPEGAWPPERPGGPLETPGLRGYKGAFKGASKRPP